MNQAFLKEVASKLQSDFPDDLQDLILVFPNRRAGIFFMKYLGEQLDKPVWSPSVYTIQDLMSRLSELDYADELELVSQLYKSYSGIRNREESFDEFFFWAEIMLADFDEVDKYLINAADLFRNLEELKQIEDSFDYLEEGQLELIRRFWSTFSMENLSVQKRHFLDIWNLLLPVYKSFRTSMLEAGSGYEGMVYRNVVSRIEEGSLPELPCLKIIFIGFNALNPCEQKLFSAYQSTGKALFFWDYDDYYLSNELHEAGKFLRENLSKFRDDGAGFRRNHLDTGKRMEIYSVPSDSGQAQVVSNILEKAAGNRKLGEETAVVLADEELLIPVLHALPEQLTEINVTMGYPVTATPVFSLVEHLISLQRNRRESAETGFYHMDVLPILQHQYISLHHREDATDLVKGIHEKNRIYIPGPELDLNPLFKAIFNYIEQPEDIAEYIIRILEMITGKQEEHPVPALELEFIYRIYTRIKRLKDELLRLEMNFNLSTFLKLFHRFLERTRIPFSGEPLAGLQVMGVLETRVLDFEHVILLSMNEGSFPDSQAGNSFIPHSLRYGFRLPTLEYKDAIYAYYFYRLIQRASEVQLVYNDKAEGLNTGEQSRYLYQLKFDKIFNISEQSVGFDVKSGKTLPIEVHKTEEIFQQLQRFSPGSNGDKYLSPSALNSFIDCSLQFYFKYVAELYEPEELSEEIDSAMFGTLLHESVRRLYQNQGTRISREDLNRLLKDPGLIEQAVDESFSEAWLKEKSSNGRNLVVREIIISYVKRILEKDISYAPINTESLEETLSVEIGLEGAGLKVRIGGKIDRIDRIGPVQEISADGSTSGAAALETYRVIDYKTGMGKMELGSIEELFEEDSAKRNHAAFQTLVYALLFKETSDHQDFPITPGVYLLRKIFDPDFRYHFRIGPARKGIPLLDFRDHESEFTEYLKAALERLFDRSASFRQTEERDTCRYCTYRNLCRR